MTTPTRAALSAAFAALITAAPLAGQDAVRESGYIKGLRACQTETDPTERLACLDTAAAALVSASSTGEVRVIDREAVRQTRRKLFGFALPDLAIFSDKGDEKKSSEAEEITALETTIAAVRPIRGSLVLTTAEGAEWQLDEIPARLMRPRVGQSLEIRSGSFSSYFLRIDGQKGVKGRRVR